MFFGLTNSLATFHMMMNDIFRELINEGVVVILCRHRLYLKAEKCTFGQPTVEYLRLILSEGHVEMDPVKVAGVCDWLTPRNITKVQSFIGFINFYWRFIQDFSQVAKPLHQPTKKGEVWKWAKDEWRAF